MQYRIKTVIATLPTSGTAHFGYPIYETITLDDTDKISGHTIKSASPQKWDSEYVYETDWLTVSNKVSGTTALKIKLYSGSGSSRSATYSYSLTVAPAMSSVSTPDGTLGTSQTLTVTRQNTTYKHTITYSCGSASGTIVTNSTATSISFTPPLSLASQNTSGTSVSITLTIKTYDANGGLIGSLQTTFSAAMPSSIKPTFSSMELSDDSGAYSTYGTYLQLISKIKASLTAVGSYGSTIASYQVTYKITVSGKEYSEVYSGNPTISKPLEQAGTYTVTAKVTDSRGRTETTSQSVSVTAYENPVITAIRVYRCLSDGTPDAGGGFAACKFSAAITSLNSRNAKSYKVQYRQVGTSEWTSVTVSNPAYDMTDTVIIFQSATASAFEIRVAATDSFSTITSAIRTVPLAFVTLQLTADGTGAALGREALNPGQLDIDMVAKFYKNVIFTEAAFHGVMSADNVSIAQGSSHTINVDTQAIYLISTGTSSNTRHGVWIAHTTGFSGSLVYVDTLVNPGTSDVSVTGGSGSITISNNAAQYSLRALYVRLF